jgi:chromate transporter
VGHLPALLPFIFLGAPYVERLRHNQTIKHALTAVTAAVAGVVLDQALWFALYTALGTVRDLDYGPIQPPSRTGPPSNPHPSRSPGSPPS